MTSSHARHLAVFVPRYGNHDSPCSRHDTTRRHHAFGPGNPASDPSSTQCGDLAIPGTVENFR
jgi:hypothetical protein